ncbi:Fc.00g002510.m01.CDS01 [Cosmosporella sp. VM-42]
MSNQPQEAEALPHFITSSNISSPFFYFYYTINPSTTALTVEVLGPNLKFKFTHRRARRHYTPSQILTQLERKTVGFLTLVTNDDKRVILASAESGHGSGRFGDALDRSPGQLSNQIWARRVIRVGKLLELNMHRPFDAAGRARVTEELKGLFLGSHVEVKLAVHAVFVLLKMFKITKDLNNITKAHLERLKTVTWEDGSRPVFEIYFSRKNCHPCGTLKHRLEMKRYPTYPTHQYKPAPGGRPVEISEIIDDQDVDFGDDVMEVDDEDSDATKDGDCEMIDVVNLIECPSILPSCEQPDPLDSVDLTQSSVEPSPQPPNAVDDYLDGLCYRIGQIESSPEGAAEATVQFAQKIRDQAFIWTAVGRTPDGKNIPKPLPATPVTEDPYFTEIQAQPRPLRRSPRSSLSPPLRRSPRLPSSPASNGSATSIVESNGGTSNSSIFSESLRRSLRTAAERRMRARKGASVPAALRDRSPRAYVISARERTALDDTPTQESRIHAEILSRRRSAEG